MGAHRLHAASKRKREVFREKFILVTIAALIALCFSVMIGVRMVRAQDDQENTQAQKYYSSIEIASGDTLWDIAERYTEGTEISVSQYVEQLMEMNQLTSDRIYEGQHLTVSYYE